MKCPNCEEGENIMKKGPGLFECEECGEDWGGYEVF